MSGVSSIFYSASDFFVSAAVTAAHDLGLFAALDESHCVDDLSRRLKVAPRALRILCDVLLAQGFLRASAGQLICVTVPPRVVVNADGWGRLTEVLRRGRPLDESAHVAEFHRHLFEGGRTAADALMQKLAAAEPAARTLLDAGGGQGAYSRAWLEQSANHTVTLIDTAPVAALARQALARFGARVRVVAGDLLDSALDLGQGYDLALLADVLHLHPPAACAQLVERVTSCARTVVLKEVAVAPDRSGPLGALLFALNMVLYTDGGDVYDEQQMSGWLRSADADIRRLDLPEAPESCVLVRSHRAHP